MQEFARSFYLSKAWRETREYVFRRDHGLCKRCGAPGEIVHHKRYLTPDNINDPSITLNENNLEVLCRNCHTLEHESSPAVEHGLAFDSEGNLVRSNTNESM